MVDLYGKLVGKLISNPMDPKTTAGEEFGDLTLPVRCLEKKSPLNGDESHGIESVKKSP